MIETEWWAYQYQAGKVQEEYVDEGFDADTYAAEIEQEAVERERAAAAVTNDWEDVDLG